MTRTMWAATLCALVWVIGARVGLAIPTEEASLNTCQKAVKTAAAAFVKNKVAAIGTCLQAVSTQIVQNNAADASAAASLCVTQFRKLNDSRSLGKSLPEKLTAGISAKCTPGGNNTHTLGDILGVGAGVSQPLNADDLNAWCSHFGGDGSIDSLQEWIDCISAAAECGVDSAIAAQYPRVLDWLVLVKPSMQSLTPPGTDPNKIADAVAGLDAVKAEIDGPDNDNVVSLQCGGIVSAGTAAVGDVLSGKTFSNSTADGLTGTMPNNGAVTLTPTTTNQTIAVGYHNGAGYCAGDANLVTGNIKSGVTIFGVSGDPNVVNTSSGTAAAGDLLSGKIAWVAGAQVTGTMPNNGAVTLTPTTTNQTIGAGYHNGAGYCAGDANLVSGNIKSGATIFGVSGNPNVVNTSGATAAAADMVSGKTAYANGSLVTGSATAGANVNGANGLKTFTIPDGLYSGSKTATANDTNLVAANIVSGVGILGVTGTQPPSQPVKTGQTQCYLPASGTIGACPGTPAGQDGELQKGDARSYTDNGDGTITDNKTGLVWEKKIKLDGTPDGTNLHDADNSYQWGGSCTSQTACSNGGTCCQTNADCTAPHACTISDGQGTGLTIFGWLAQLNAANFGGHNDWRIPNVNELLSIVNYGTFSPSVSAAFQGASCGGACTDITSAACSCTQSHGYWSASSYQPVPPLEWFVFFLDGSVGTTAKSLNSYVRAVRGGL